MKSYLLVKGKVLMHKLKEKFKEEDGASFIDTALKILTGLIIGALVLAGLYFMFGDIVLPTLMERVTNLFDYDGGSYTP